MARYAGHSSFRGLRVLPACIAGVWADVTDRVHTAARRKSRSATHIEGREPFRNVHSLGPTKNANGRTLRSDVYLRATRALRI